MTRAEQKEARKKDILMYALELFVKKGYNDTKVSDIAECVQMSTGLLFHYFDSKESLYRELVTMGAEGAKRPQTLGELLPEKYFDVMLKQLFDYAAKEPWVFRMFVLMGQARKNGMPEDIRQIALSVDQIAFSAEMIKKGQEKGVFREGDPMMLSTCFWASVQGVMELMASDSGALVPEPEWLTAILKK